MSHHLHIDIETYSSIDIMGVGAYRYMESVDFEILLVAYAFDEEPVQLIDLANGQVLPRTFLRALEDPSVLKHAHNANFERGAFRTIGLDVPVVQWECSAVKSAYCGYPLSLGQVSEAMGLGDKGKDAKGRALIKYFSCPVRPTNTNGGRRRNMPHHDPEKWEAYQNYCIQDVVAEREIMRRLATHTIPEMERRLYALDQKINDTGAMVDTLLAKRAMDLADTLAGEMGARVKEITGLDNPNSPAQLKDWLGSAMKRDISSLAKEHMKELKGEAVGAAREVLKLRSKMAKSSTKKYAAMLNCVGEGSRVRGLLQFYGATRTGRWAGRLVQVQNLPRTYLEDLPGLRAATKRADRDLLAILYDDTPTVLSQLIRTAFVAKDGHVLAVSDFSAIEARVIAWLADEDWRVDVFRTHGKIYEASASIMFGVPLDEITTELRRRGKVAELSLGYQGGVGALKKMGGEAMGLSEPEMRTIVARWRKANPKVVRFWADVEACAIAAITTKQRQIDPGGRLVFEYVDDCLLIRLPSGRELFYREPRIRPNRFGRSGIQFKGLEQAIRKWTDIETYGGKLVENVVQAVARDCLGQAMLEVDRAGYTITMHVHDEVVCEVPEAEAEKHLRQIDTLMRKPIPWAKGLPMGSAGYVSPFYKKD